MPGRNNSWTVEEDAALIQAVQKKSQLYPPQRSAAAERNSRKSTIFGTAGR